MHRFVASSVWVAAVSSSVAAATDLAEVEPSSIDSSRPRQLSSQGEGSNEVGRFTCRFRIDDHTRSVYYNGTSHLADVDWGQGHWNSTRSIVFDPWPGAYMVISGQDVNGDFFKSGGFWADCPGAPKDKLDSAWESFCSNDMIDDLHMRGEGWGWTPATFKLGGQWHPGTLGSPNKEYCAFRMVPLKADSYRCDIKVDDYVRAVHYNGVDLTKTVAGDLNRWDAMRRVSFPPIPGAYLVIYGEDWKGDFYGKGGFWADCDTAASKDIERAWESFCSPDKLGEEYQKGGGSGWAASTFHAKSHGGSDWAPGTLGDAGKGHCVFRMMPVKVPSPTTTQPPTTTAKASSAAVVDPAADEDASPTTTVTTTTEAPRPEPPDVPPNWKPIWVEKHKAYYFWEIDTNKTTWKLAEVHAEVAKEHERKKHKMVEDAKKFNRPCTSQEECLDIVDRYLEAQPRQENLLLRTYGPGSLGGGDCGEMCELPETCPTDPLLPGCRYDTYDNAMAAIYLTKRGKLAAARSILDAFSDLLYPESLDDVPEHVRYVGPSGRTLTLLAAAYSDAGKAKAGQYESDSVYDGAVDVGNNAWAALAFAHYAAAAGSPCHAAIARDILHAVSSGSSACSDDLGGVIGRLEPWPRHYRSTEHNIDVSALAKVLGEDKVWEKAHNFVRSMFARNRGYNSSYSMGTGDDHKCDASQPVGPVPADCTYWNLLADADPNRERMAAAVSFALRSPHPEEPSSEEAKSAHKSSDPNWENQQGMWTEDEDIIHYTGTKLHGTRFTTWGNGIQWEVTASAAMALLRFEKKYGELDDAGKKVDLSNFVAQIRSSLELLLGMYHGVPGSVLGGNRDAWVKWTLKPDKWRRDVSFPGGTDTGVSWSYLRYNHIASTAWSGLFLLYQASPGGKINEDANPLAPPSAEMPKPAEGKEDQVLSCLGHHGKASGQAEATHKEKEADKDEKKDGKGEHEDEEDEEQEVEEEKRSTTTAQTTVVQTTTTLETSSSSTAASSTSSPSTTSSTSPAPTTSSEGTTTLPEELEFKLWKAWKHEHPKVHKLLPKRQEGLVADIRVTDLLGGDLGLKLDETLLTVTGFSEEKAEHTGWRIGDRIVAVDAVPLKGIKDFKHRLTEISAQEDCLAHFTVLRMDICSHSCAELVTKQGKACTTTWADICVDSNDVPHQPLSSTSSLTELCPAECGEPVFQGPWTHLTRPGTEVFFIGDGLIHWQSGKTTTFKAVRKDTEMGSDVKDFPTKFSTDFQGQTFYGLLFENGTLAWSDGDVWVRAAGMPKSAPPKENEREESWKCHHYVGNQGASAEWCSTVGWEDGSEFKYFGPQSPCDGCWCCKRKAPNPKAALVGSAESTVSAEAGNEYDTGDFAKWRREHKDSSDPEYAEWLKYKHDHLQKERGPDGNEEFLRMLDQSQRQQKFLLGERWSGGSGSSVGSGVAVSAVLPAVAGSASGLTEEVPIVIDDAAAAVAATRADDSSAATAEALPWHRLRHNAGASEERGQAGSLTKAQAGLLMPAMFAVCTGAMLLALTAVGRSSRRPSVEQRGSFTRLSPEEE